MGSMIDDDIVQRVADSLGVTESEARRVVGDVITYYHEPLEMYVQRRHEECRKRGLANAEAYALIAAETANRVVAAPALTERQVRRIIYG
jgi:hypothetical protein